MKHKFITGELEHIFNEGEKTIIRFVANVDTSAIVKLEILDNGNYRNASKIEFDDVQDSLNCNDDLFDNPEDYKLKFIDQIKE